MKKPDWSTAPDWANWLAKDHEDVGGSWSWFSKKPELVNGSWLQNIDSCWRHAADGDLNLPTAQLEPRHDGIVN